MSGAPRATSELALLVAFLTLAGGPGDVCAQGPSLNVLLTNDDGFEAPGLEAIRAALSSAGHRVTVVAPVENKSGGGTSITTGGTIDYYEQATDVWAVDGTPSDAVTLALVHVMRSDPPDLVVSGANFGENVGANVLSSGTVGAALTAARAGVPAIAVSVGLDPREGDRSQRFSSTYGAFGPAAELVADIVRQLAETGGAGLLPPRTVLNVNYPPIGPGEPAGVRFATVSSLRGFRQVFSVAGDTGPARVELVAANRDRAEEGSDLALLSSDFVTISVLDGNWDAGRGSWQSLQQRLIIER